MGNSRNIEWCGWENNDCNSCPYHEYENNVDSCAFKEEFMKFLEWLYVVIKQRCGINPISWGGAWRIYYGPKEVHELLVYDFPHDYRTKFWELWRDGGKKVFKKLGFGIFKDRDEWILFWETKFRKILLETLHIEND